MVMLLTTTRQFFMPTSLHIQRRRNLPLSLISWFLYTGSVNSFTKGGLAVSAGASFQKNTCVAFSSSSTGASGSDTALNQSTSKSNISTSSSTLSMLSLSSMKVWDDGRSESMNKCILPLSSNSHKGSSGRVAILGGSARYTGAPYYAAMASLQAGADLAYVFTAQEAAVPIKCYSPELMVAPVYSATAFDAIVETGEPLDSEDAQRLVNDMVQQVVDSMPRLHCLVIGPGLGRCPLVFQAVAGIMKAAREQNLFMVVDADALYMLSLPEYRNLLQGYDKVVLTPNVIEYQRLLAANEEKDGDGDRDASPTNFASAVMVVKGEHDEIHRNGARVMVCEEPGGLKRSGGIGDVLAGTVSTLVAWHVILKDRNVGVGTTTTDADLLLSCWTACCFIKRATQRAFASNRRSMTAPDVLDELGPSIDTMTS